MSERSARSSRGNESGGDGRAGIPERPGRKIAGWRDPLLLAAGALYVVVVVATAAHHEPWRDEADVWLAARDSSVAGFFARAGYAGTPPLWYLAVAPLVRAGLPYGSMLALNTAVAIMATLLVLFGLRDVPRYLRITFVFSYYIVYEYAVIARPYALLYLLLIAIAIAYRRRLESPILFALLVAALSLTNGHGALLAGGIALVTPAELAWRGRGSRRWVAASILVAAVAVTAWMLWPRGGGQIAGEVFGWPAWNMWRIALSKALFPGAPPVLSIVTAVLMVGIGLMLVRRSLWLAAWAGAGFAGLSYLYLWQPTYEAFLRHFGPLALWLLTVVVIALRERAAGRAERWVAIGLALAFGGSTVLGLERARLEWGKPYSGAAEAGAFLGASGLGERPLAMFRATSGSAVLPYLERGEVYYPGEDRMGTYMRWDRRYAVGVARPLELVVERTKHQFRNSGGILVVDQSVPGSSELDLRLVWRSEVEPFGATDEAYLIYEVPAATE